MSNERIAKKTRKTSETSIEMELNLDGSGKSDFKTNIGFFDHMLDHLTRHGKLDLSLDLEGDLHIDAHHSVEDVSLVLGGLLGEALGDKSGISRYGHFTLPMDEVLVTVAIDLSGRYHFVCNNREIVRDARFNGYEGELTLEFLEKLAMSAKMNLHVVIHHGENRHHIHEAIFKALGRALRMAVARDEKSKNEIPSTKGVLE